MKKKFIPLRSERDAGGDKEICETFIHRFNSREKQGEKRVGEKMRE